jgi:hypothetical protein
MAPRGTILTSAFFLWSSCSDMGFGAGVSTRAIVVSIFLVSMKIFTPLGCQLERGRKRLFNRGIWVGNRGKPLVVTSVTAIRDPPKLSMHPMRKREKAMSMSCTTGQLCTATARQTPDTPDVALVRSIAAGNKHAMRCLHVTTCGSSDLSCVSSGTTRLRADGRFITGFSNQCERNYSLDRSGWKA